MNTRCGWTTCLLLIGAVAGQSVCATVDKSSRVSTETRPGATFEAKVTFDNIDLFSFNNLKKIKLPIRGIVVDHHGLGCGAFGSSKDFGAEDAAAGIVWIHPHYQPWAWMNDHAVRLTDRLVDLVIAHYGLAKDFPVCSAGGSMGGQGAYVYARYSRQNVRRVVVNCGVADLAFHYTERPDLPRTITAAFADAPDFVTELQNRSPVALAKRGEMPSVDYVIFHSDKDTAVNIDRHAVPMVAALQAVGNKVEYHVSKGTGHTELTPELVKRYYAAIRETFRCFFDLETGDWSISAQTAAAGSDVRFEPEAGARLQTKALQAAIDRAAANGGGRVVVPAGAWPIASVFFKPGTTLKLEKGATLKGSERREDYPETTIKIEGTLRKGLAALVNADRVDGFRIEGPGVIDGSGAPYWRDPGRPRPKLLSISRCRGVTLADVTLKNSPFWTCHIQNSSDILVTGCTILSEKTGGAEPINTDAIDLDGVENVQIRDSYMDVNNDAVALKGGKGPDANDFMRHPENGPCRNVLVENCTFGPLCFAGVTIGSECVVASNVVLRNSRFNGSGATLYIKMRLDTPQLYTDIVATNLSGTARQGLYVKPYLSRSRPEWEKLEIPSVATNVVYDPGPAFTTPKPRVVIPHPACHLHLSAADGEMSAKR